MVTMEAVIPVAARTLWLDQMVVVEALETATFCLDQVAVAVAVEKEATVAVAKEMAVEAALHSPIPIL